MKCRSSPETLHGAQSLRVQVGEARPELCHENGSPTLRLHRRAVLLPGASGELSITDASQTTEIVNIKIHPNKLLYSSSC